jgi:hypothetical protein
MALPSPRLRPMRIRISDPELIGDLLASLMRANCPVERVGEDGIEIGSPSPLLTPDQARKEISLYLVLWRVKNPTVLVTLDD